MINLQPTDLKSELIALKPLKKDDFERLYLAASDPLIWEQHPDKMRYQLEIFKVYFDGAINSSGALIVLNSITEEVLGCSRYYNYDSANNTIMIGYTFLVRKCWGGAYNSHLKKLMVNYALTYFDAVLLQIGASNIRSQKATEKLGAIKVKEEMLEFPSQGKSLHFVYMLTKENFNP